MKKISIITPCFNEELSIENCINELKILMEKRLPDYEYEHIISDNASTDRTVEIITSAAMLDKRIKVLVNSRNVGPFRNMWSGMKHATGDAIIPFLPADLQDPVDIIPEFVRLWESGSQIVYGVRTNRIENFFIKKFRSIYYRIIRKFSQLDIPLNAGEFLLADKRVADSVLQTEDQYPYIRGLFAQTNARFGVVPYTWGVRNLSVSKNNLFTLIDQAINGFISTNRIFMRIMILSGLFFAFVGILIGIISFIILFFSRESIDSGIPTLIVGLFILGGTQLVFLGVIGEYVQSIHNQVRRSPAMFLENKINFGALDQLDK
jgi:glycosyltransferase involved in cell wall biosynthesis